jgi:hypothetical protein
MGPLGVLGGHFSWFANPLAWLSWKKCYPPERAGAVLFSITAFALASTFMLTDKIPQGSAGSYDYAIGSGYLVWLASLALFIAAAAVLPSDVPAAAEDTMPNKSLERTRER